LTAEQLEASRSERMRLNGRGQLTIDEARTWLEETGLCLFLPKRQFASFTAPTFVEAVAGEQTSSPSAKLVTYAEELLVRLESENVAVRLNLLGQPGDEPDFVVAAWVLPYVYALRGDRDWRRIPQLTGSRQVSQLAVQAYKQLETGDQTITQLRHSLGREVSESAVLRAITELWQQLRIIPVVSAPGKSPQWQLLRVRYQKAIAEGASTSQVTAISVLASIYLQAVIAASMEEVEMFLAPLTARSKVREVLRGLVATRQVHSLALGHAPHFYVAGTLPEFAAPTTIYASSSMPASSYFLRSYEHEETVRFPVTSHAAPQFVPTPVQPPKAAEPVIERPPQPIEKAPAAQIEKPAAARTEKTPAARPRFSHQPTRARDRKPVQKSATGRVARRPIRDARSAAPRATGSPRHAQGSRWAKTASKNGNGNGNGHNKRLAPHAGKSSSNGARFSSNGHSRTGNGSNGLHKAKPTAARTLRNGHSTSNGHSANGKAAAKPARRAVSSRPDASRKSARPVSRTGSRPDARGSRKPALSASAKAGNRSRYGFTASSNRRSKKRG
jgi:23S rRNA pseudouridine2605 synthase